MVGRGGTRSARCDQNGVRVWQRIALLLGALGRPSNVRTVLLSHCDDVPQHRWCAQGRGQFRNGLHLKHTVTIPHIDSEVMW